MHPFLILVKTLEEDAVLSLAGRAAMVTEFSASPGRPQLFSASVKIISPGVSDTDDTYIYHCISGTAFHDPNFID